MIICQSLDVSQKSEIESNNFENSKIEWPPGAVQYAPFTEQIFKFKFYYRYIIQMEPRPLQRQSNLPGYLVLGKHFLKQQPLHH